MGVRKILVVEDSNFVGTLLQEKLRRARYTTVWTKSKAETVELLDGGGHDFFCAILDFKLPDAQDGSVIGEVVGRGIPGIVFTGDLSTEVRDLVWAKNVVDYVLKDNAYAPDYLIGMLKRLERNELTKVLVVDDSGFFCQVIANLLKIQKFKVFTAGNGREALAVVAQHPEIRLVVTDYQMPEMDGLQLTQALRAKYAREDMSIIGISAKGEHIMAARFIKYGANDFIIKQSFLTEEFYSRVNQCLDNLENIRLIREAAIKDFLTGLYNRRYFFDVGHKLFANMARQNITLTCCMIDIDFFKKVNDTYGHEVGDLTLRHISDILRTRMREGDIVARLGGEEFCILAVNVDPAAVAGLFEDLRRRVEEAPVNIGGGQQLAVTVSIGVAAPGAYSLEEMVRMADEQMYLAKKSGRNQVVVGEPVSCLRMEQGGAVSCGGAAAGTGRPRGG
ncbi:MAG: diguanylate cyclase [Desulfobulbaceae bacterium]|nr:diguanylate cyclase [Desulfobulbaceae bacterium]